MEITNCTGRFDRTLDRCLPQWYAFGNLHEPLSDHGYRSRFDFRRSADRTGNGGSRRAGIYGIRSISGRKCTAEPDGAWNHRKYYGDHNERRRSRCCDSSCIIVPVCGCIPVCDHTCLHSNGRCQRHSDKSAGQ